MADRWQVRVFDDHQLVHTADVQGIVELGRATDKEAPPYHTARIAGVWRVVIARLDETSFSRKHLRIEPLANDRARLQNLSNTLPVRLTDGSQLAPGGAREVRLPVVVSFGKRSVRFQPDEADDATAAPLQSLVEVTRAPRREEMSRQLKKFSASTDSISLETLMPWLHTALAVLQSAAGASDFFDKAARAMVDLVDMDSGRVLVRDGDDWHVAAQADGGRADASWRPSRQVLSRVLEEKRTFWNTPAQAAASLVEIKAVVAAPISDRNGDVIGALYGDRRQGDAGARPVSKLDAMLVELLASGVAAGLSRVEQEQAAVRAQVQFEQYFTPQLARQLATQPDLLEGRDADVTLLFCDIRGFSRISSQLGPVKTFEWIGSVMEALSACVYEHGGVLVNYIGDELMAMWGAPEAQPDHAALACRAALRMLECLPALDERWRGTLGAPLAVGVGVNTGPARVGNTGSTRRRMYGPLGNTVNLASRVQGATKYLKTPLLITEATRARLGDEFRARRLCQVRVVNIPEPVALYELAPTASADWAALRTGYEAALAEFERGEFRQSAASLGRVLGDFPLDGPSLILLARAANALVQEPEHFDPVWELGGK
ncbi:MAG: adenylate/guanylate cyclase domain-containing protein [Planctomycetia bacterium]|nr:adenylate/guanylate cyclase domain-containing protein [Planctomycetia bacterium]